MLRANSLRAPAIAALAAALLGGSAAYLGGCAVSEAAPASAEADFTETRTVEAATGKTYPLFADVRRMYETSCPDGTTLRLFEQNVTRDDQRLQYHLAYNEFPAADVTAFWLTAVGKERAGAWWLSTFWNKEDDVKDFVCNSVSDIQFGYGDADKRWRIDIGDFSKAKVVPARANFLKRFLDRRHYPRAEGVDGEFLATVVGFDSEVRDGVRATAYASRGSGATSNVVVGVRTSDNFRAFDLGVEIQAMEKLTFVDATSLRLDVTHEANGAAAPGRLDVALGFESVTVRGSR